MNSCKNCNKETKNPAFCSRSCAQSYNNKLFKKREVEGSCAICKAPIPSSRAYCSDACRGKARSIRRQNSTAKTGYENIKNHRQRVKLKAVEYKGGSCKICGYNKTSSSLDFHHIDPSTKDFSLSGKYHLTWDTIQAELDKCILVCRNCHGEIHDGTTKMP